MSKRRHHLQPRFYLKGFVSDQDKESPKVWVYEKGKPFYDGKTEQLQNPRHLTITKAARKKDFYAFENQDGKKDYEKYENILRDDFEEPARPVLEKIIYQEEISQEEKKALLRYTASMVTRSNWWKNISDQIDKIVEPATKADIEYITDEIVKIAKEQNDTEFSDASKLRAFFEKNVLEEVKKRKKGEYEKDAMIRYAERFTEVLETLQIQFLIAPANMLFLTSDNPVCYTSFDNREVHLFFPISSKICLFGSRINEKGFDRWRLIKRGIWQIDDRTVEKIRGFLVSRAVTEIYYAKKSTWLVEYINKNVNVPTLK